MNRERRDGMVSDLVDHGFRRVSPDADGDRRDDWWIVPTHMTDGERGTPYGLQNAHWILLRHAFET